FIEPVPNPTVNRFEIAYAVGGFFLGTVAVGFSVGMKHFIDSVFFKNTGSSNGVNGSGLKVDTYAIFSFPVNAVIGFGVFYIVKRFGVLIAVYYFFAA